MQGFQHDFIRFIIEQRALLFGEFRTKSGRLSPYFYDSGRFLDGASLMQLGRYYATAIRHHGIEFDVLYGPAYKGIPLAVATAIALHQEGGGRFPWCFNRKEVKGHGEGGMTVGAPLAGRVLIVDDVITAGTSVGAACDLIRQNGAEPCAAIVALDREERGQDGGLPAISEATQGYGLPVLPIVTLSHILTHLEAEPDQAEQVARIRNYREKWGVAL